MRSVSAGSYERLTSFAKLWRAYRSYRRGKSRRPKIAAFDLDADTHLLALYRHLRNGTYRPGRYRIRVIRDPKLRLIAAPEIADRVLHQALIDDIGPTYERGFHPFSFACGQGRGPHRAILRHLAWSRQHRYRLGLDIRRYFLSVNRPILAQLIGRRLRDEQTKKLVEILLDAGGAVYREPLAVEILGLDTDPLSEASGLAIGSYLSQWCGSLYLSGLDHLVSRDLKIGAYLRYMDDFVLFSNDPEQLTEVRGSISEWLCSERRLELNRKRWRVLPTSQPTTFLGYRVSRAGITPGRKLKRRMHKRLRKLRSASCSTAARSLRSYQGLMTFG